MRFNNYEITADSLNWKLEEVSTVKESKNPENIGKEIFSLVGYYSSLESLTERLRDATLREVWSMSNNTKEVTEMLVMELEDVSKIKDEVK